jgi:hypothetical protein
MPHGVHVLRESAAQHGLSMLPNPCHSARRGGKAARFVAFGSCSSAPLRGAGDLPPLRPAACASWLTGGNEAAIGAASKTEGNRTMSNTPKFYAYTVKDRGKDKKGIWTRIGAAFAHEKSGGFTIELAALPIDGKIVLMPPKADAAPGDSFESEVR